MTAEELLRAGIEAARQRNREEASRLLSQAVRANPNLEAGWLWLGLCRADPKEREYCFRRVLALNPDNQEAQKRLAQINGTPPPHAPARSSNVPSVAPQSKTGRRKVVLRPKPKSNEGVWMWAGLGILAVCVIFIGAGLFYWLRTTSSLSATGASVAPTATLIPSPTPQNYTATFEAGACPFTPPVGSRVDCGFVIAPEDRSGDLSDTIRLAVAIYRSANPNPAPDPIIYISGGPGGESLNWTVGAYPTVIAPLIGERDFIAFDQRGIGYSAPVLDCGQIQDTYLKDLRDQLPDGEELFYYQGAAASCYNKFTERGINLKRYNSAASAADTKDIIVALGYSQANLYGVSYGTRIAQVVMRDYPQVARSAILDSVVPVDTNMFEVASAPPQNQVDLLLATCANDPQCAAAYPDLARAYAETFQSLERQPVTLHVDSTASKPETEQVDGDKFASLIVLASKYAPALPLIPQTIARARQGDFSAIELTLSSSSYTFDNITMGVFVSFFCHEQVYASTPEKLGDALFDLCEIWDADPLGPGENEPVRSDIPTLILAGTLDPATPPYLAERVQQGLTHSRLVTFASQAHAPSTTDASGCAQIIIRSFLQNPEAGPDVSCLQTSDRLSFLLPYTGNPPTELTPTTVARTEIHANIPAGWADIGNGFFSRNNSFADRTVIGIQKSTISETRWVNWLVTGFQPYGLDNLPVRYDARTSSGLTWNLYKATARGLPAEIAFTKSKGYTIMVLLLAHPDEHQALLETVFLPILDSVEY
ncbi:MAG: alpha/beta hydrolase [Chloroflexota bacterium]